MNAHKLTATFTEDGKIVLTGLPFHAGDTVEIIVLEQSKDKKLSQDEKYQYPLEGTVLQYDDPFEAAVSTEDWEVLK